jgi:hypothetical protein
MSKLNVYTTLSSSLNKRQTGLFHIYQDGRKLGTLAVGKKSVEWSDNSNHQYTFSWQEFDILVKSKFKEKHAPLNENSEVNG